MTENEFRDIVRANIRRFRDYRNWTQAEFAEKLDISVNFLSDVENGKRWISPASMVKFASVLNIEPYELFKPADKQPASVSNLISKYNNDVILAVSNSINQVYNYYQAIVETETKKNVKR
ncbi:MAG: helix-turn-helix transcriptional regulator [Treponema sp.]|nr:helix-turn-helix transcriptional regulator [Treponema sp.]MCL2238085.1 helix-turn-helix transcriptional regulator [Treponema sp.]